MSGVTVYAVPAPPNLEAATVPLHEFAATWDSPRAHDLILSSLRAVLRHPMCERDNLSPARIGIDLLSGEIFMAWVDADSDIAFVTSSLPMAGADAVSLHPPLAVSPRSEPQVLP